MKEARKTDTDQEITPAAATQHKKPRSKSDKILEQLVLVREALKEADESRERTPFWALALLLSGMLVYLGGGLINRLQETQRIDQELQETIDVVREAKQEKFQLSQRLESISLELLRIQSSSPAAARLVEQYGIERR